MATNPRFYELRHTGWDVVLGVVVVLAGLVVLGHTAIASVISMLFLGWLLFIGGGVLIAGALLRLRQSGFWQSMIGGALFLALGIGSLRNPAMGLAVLSLLAGCLFLAGGIARLASAFQGDGLRVPLLINAVLTIIVGLLILFQWPLSAMWVLGLLIGIQILVEGFTMIFVGRLRPLQAPSAVA